MFRVKDRHWRDRLMTQCFPAHCSYNVAGNAPKFPPATGMWLVDLMQLMKININSNVSFHTASTPRSHGGHITKSNCPNQQTALTHVNYTLYHNCSQTSLAHLWVPRVCPSRGGGIFHRGRNIKYTLSGCPCGHVSPPAATHAHWSANGRQLRISNRQTNR